MSIQEEVVVLFHASVLGRADVVQNAIATIRATAASEEELARIISTGRNEDNATPLHIAAKYGHSDVIRALLNAGADVCVVPKEGDYLDKKPYEIASDATKQVFHVYLFEQIAIGNVSSINRLFNGGISVDTTDNTDDRDSLLHWACSFGSVDVTSFLLVNGCDPNVENANGQTPLHYTCKNGHVALAEILLKEGAVHDKLDKNGYAPIDLLKDKESLPWLELFQNRPEVTKPLHTIYEEKCKKIQEQALAQAQKEKEKHEDVTNQELNYIDIEKKNQNIHDFYIFDDEQQPQQSFEDKDNLLIFWPPVRKQSKHAKHQHQHHQVQSSPMMIRSNENLLICVASSDIDVFPLMTWSGLLDTMDIYSIQVQVKRTSHGAKIRIGIDQNICPGRHSYELNINSDQISILASDRTGLLYGVQTFIQLLQLHSDIKTNSTDGSHIISIPAITISDRPGIDNRGVLWSYRTHCRLNTTTMVEQVVLCSKLRINQIYLVIDTLNEQGTFVNDSNHVIDGSASVTQTPTKSKLPPSSPRKNPLNIQDTVENKQHAVAATKIYALDEVCKRHCVELVPTVVITSMHQRLCLDYLKNFSHTVISIVFLFEPSQISHELNEITSNFNSVYGVELSKEHTPEDVINACIQASENILKDTREAGFTSIIISSSNWTRNHVDPMKILSNLGLCGIEKDISIMYPVNLFSKPLIGVHDYIQSLYSYSMKLEDVGASISIFPAFMDKSFMYPMIMIKYFTFLYAGFTWYRQAVVDILNDPMDTSLFNLTVIRPILKLILFGTFPNNIHKEAYRTLSQLFMNEIWLSELKEVTSKQQSQQQQQQSDDLATTKQSHQHQQLSKNSLNNSSMDGMDNITSPSQLMMTQSEIAKAEKVLWSLLSLSNHQLIHCVPSKLEASLCLKLLKRTLLNAQWKPNNNYSIGMSSTSVSTNLFSIDFGLSYSNSGSNNNNSNVNDLNGNSYDSNNTSNNSNQTHINDEMEELYTIMNLLSILCKAIVLSYNSYQKQHKITSHVINHMNLSYQKLFETLPIGTKSDIANSLLEALSNCTQQWKKRFDHNLCDYLRTINELTKNNTNNNNKNNKQYDNGKTIIELQQNVSSGHNNNSNNNIGNMTLWKHSMLLSNKNYIYQDQPTIPGAAVFKALTDQLTLPSSVEVFIARLFSS